MISSGPRGPDYATVSQRTKKGAGSAKGSVTSHVSSELLRQSLVCDRRSSDRLASRVQRPSFAACGPRVGWIARGEQSDSRDLSGGGVASPRHCLTFPRPTAFLSTVLGDALDHLVVNINSDYLQQAAGAAQVGPQAAGAAQVGPQAAGAAQAGAQAGAAHVGAQPVEQPVLQQLLRTLQQRILGQRIFGIVKQDFLQPVLQQVGAGAQQLGAQAAGAAQAGAQAGAAHVGAQAAGAAQQGAGAAHEACAQPQPLLRWWNRPASALLMLAKQTSAAVIHANFISVSPTEAGPWNVRDCRALFRTPCQAVSTCPWTQSCIAALSFRTRQTVPLSQTFSI